MTRIDIRRASERGVVRTSWLEAQCSFSFGPFQRADRDGFGALHVLNQDWIAPNSGFAMHPHQDLEILLMPLQSVTAHQDTLGNRVMVGANELLVMRAGRGISHSQMNASATEQDHHLQIWLLPRIRNSEPVLQHHRFNAADRQDRWEMWASGYGEPDVPIVDADARIYRALLSPGASLTTPQAAAHSAYLHVVTGRLQLRVNGANDQLAAGDAVALSQAGELRLQLQALESCELLFVEQPTLEP